MTSVKCGIRAARLRLAAWIAGGNLFTYEGCKPNREWVKGEIIVTPEGFAAMRAAFWTGATTRAHTALSTPNHALHRGGTSLNETGGKANE